MKTLRRFIEEDDMDFDEAAESAVEKRKFLLNRVVKQKLFPDESDDDQGSDKLRTNLGPSEHAVIHCEMLA